MSLPTRGAVALVAVLALSACDGGPATSVKAHDTTSSSPHAGAKAEGKRIELRSGLSFAAPARWDEISLDTVGEALASGPGGDVINVIADRMGVSRKQFRAQIKSLDTFLAAPHATHGFLANMTGLTVRDTLPAKGSVELQFRSLGATDIAVQQTHIAGDDALSVRYFISVKTAKVYGHSIFVETDGETSIITVSTGNAADTERLAAGVVDTIATD